MNTTVQTASDKEQALTILRELERTPCSLHDHALKRNQVDCTVCWIERIASELTDAYQRGVLASTGEVVGTLKAKDIFEALKRELDHPSGYISKDPLTLDSITVDGTISCTDIAEFLNARPRPDESSR